MKQRQLKVGDAVMLMPFKYDEIWYGRISSVNDMYYFVRFFGQEDFEVPFYRASELLIYKTEKEVLQWKLSNRAIT